MADRIPRPKDHSRSGRLLTKLLVGLEDPELLRAVQREEGLIEATNDDFQVIHDLASGLGFLPQ